MLISIIKHPHLKENLALLSLLGEGGAFSYPYAGLIKKLVQAF
jgi:hypothetical protein